MNSIGVEWSVIRASEAFDLAKTIDCGQAFRWREESSDRRGRQFEGVAFGNLIRLKMEGDDLLFTTAPDDPDYMKPAIEEYLGLRHDLNGIYAALREDAPLASAIERHPGLRVMRQEPWECLISFICSANNNIKRIKQHVEDMSAEFGREIEGADTDRRAFPSPEALAAAGEDALRDLRLGFRAKYVAAAAETVAAGGIDLFALREAPYEDALDAITQLRGVGDKIGNCVLLFSLDKLESFPVDVHVERALREIYFADAERAPTKTRMREWAQERFGRHAGYANQYLFYDDLLAGRR